MSSSTTVTCDGCKKEIGPTHYASEFYLTLSPTRRPHDGSGSSFAMYIEPPIDRDLHFCHLKCLSAWINTPKP